FSLGIGIFFLPQKIDEVAVNTLVLPMYGNVYLLAGEHRPFFTYGYDYVSITAKANIGEINQEVRQDLVKGFYKVWGFGYELRTEGGFVVRLAYYDAILFGRLAKKTFGLSFGASFYFSI